MSHEDKEQQHAIADMRNSFLFIYQIFLKFVENLSER
jgi:hypothetical protein